MSCIQTTLLAQGHTGILAVCVRCRCVNAFYSCIYPATTAGYCTRYKNIMSRDRVCARNPLCRFATIDAFDYFYYYRFQTSFRRVRWKKRKNYTVLWNFESPPYESEFETREVCTVIRGGSFARRLRPAAAQRFRGDVVSCCRRLSREPAHTPVTNDRLLCWRNFFYFRVQILTFFFLLLLLFIPYTWHRCGHDESVPSAIFRV